LDVQAQCFLVTRNTCLKTRALGVVPHSPRSSIRSKRGRKSIHSKRVKTGWDSGSGNSLRLFHRVRLCSLHIEERGRRQYAERGAIYVHKRGIFYLCFLSWLQYIWDLRFSQWRCRRFESCGMLRHVVWIKRFIKS